jgi:hypothetical protein
MNLRFVLLPACLAALACGCKKEPAELPGGQAAREEAVPEIQALEPHDMAQEVSRRPVLRWKLPQALGALELVSVTLFESGQVDDPRRHPDRLERIAFASGLAASSAAELDPFAPPALVILTGPLRDMTQLKPETWYAWRVRAIGSGQAMEETFYFRTRAEDAVPTAPKSAVEPTPAAPPLPAPQSPTPIAPQSLEPPANEPRP